MKRIVLCIAGPLDGQCVEFNPSATHFVVPVLTAAGMVNVEYEYINGVLICIKAPDVAPQNYSK